MIFYFTGTGNSLFAAKRLQTGGEQLINIADAMKRNEYDYEVPSGENVGLVFPVYFYTVPAIIGDFVSKLNIKGAEYIYAIITCGGGISQAGSVLMKQLAKKGLKLSYVKPLLMPDNSMLFYQIPPTEAGRDRLDNAKRRLADLLNDIKARKELTISSGTFVSDMVGLGYKLCNKTAKFYADDSCVGCGLCEKICPQEVIALKDGKPQWTKPTCSKCSACINRCPKGAIQYGEATKKRNRYVNPEVKENVKGNLYLKGEVLKNKW